MSKTNTDSTAVADAKVSFGHRIFFLIFAKILSLILKTVFYYYLLKARDESVPTGGDVPTNQPSGSTVVPMVATPSGTNVSSIDFDLGDRN